MITDAIITVLFLPFTAALTLLPDVGDLLPAFINSSVGTTPTTLTLGEVFYDAGQSAGVIAYWFPAEALITAATAVGAVYVFVGAVRIVQKVLSLLTGGGGAG